MKARWTWTSAAFGIVSLGLCMAGLGADVEVRLDSDDGSSALVVYDSNSVEQARVDSDGKVGIGTDAPQGKLEVFGGKLIVNGNIMATDNFTGLGFRYSGMTGEGAIMSSYDDGVGFLTFYTKAGLIYPITRRMIIDPNGYVGIGTDDPATLLEVYKPGIAITPYSDGLVNIGESSGFHVTLDGSQLAGRNGTDPGPLWLNFYGGGVYIGPEDALSVSTNGKVGIGTGGGAQDDTLKVDGTAYFVGKVGIGSSSTNALEVTGDARVHGMMRMGSETGTSDSPYMPIMIRRLRSIDRNAHQVIARTDTLTLERDGTYGGLIIVNVANPGYQTIAAMGVTSAGSPVSVATALADNAPAGYHYVATDAQNVVYLHVSFGNAYNQGHLTEVSLSRHPGDFYYMGTITSTYNQ